jgi:hypothetical protein
LLASLLTAFSTARAAQHDCFLSLDTERHGSFSDYSNNTLTATIYRGETAVLEAEPYDPQDNEFFNAKIVQQPGGNIVAIVYPNGNTQWEWAEPHNWGFSFTPTTTGTYTYYIYAVPIYAPQWTLYGTCTITVVAAPSPLPPKAILTADSYYIGVGKSTALHADFSVDSINGDTLTASNIDQPLGTPVPGSDGSAQTHRDYTFTSTSAGTYTFVARMATQNYPWGTYQSQLPGHTGATTTITVVAPPSFTTQPSPVSVTGGQTATFTVAATPCYFQWQRLPAGSSTWVYLSDGGSYKGTLTSTLSVITSTSLTENQDQFRCVAYDSYNANVYSQSVVLTVHAGPAPTVGTLADVTAPVNLSAVFSATATGGPTPYTYSWQYKAPGASNWVSINGDGSLFDGASCSGSKTANLVISTLIQGMTGTQFRCTVSDIWGGNTSNAATLTIGAAVAISNDGGDIPAMPPLALGTFAVLLFAAGSRFFGKRKNSE